MTTTTTTTTSFAAFTDGADVIQRTLDAVQGEKTQHDQINAVYEIEECVEWIKSNGFKRVALQFPDELLADAASVTRALSEHTDSKIFILGDTSYGSCCVDEVAAEHNSADCVIHYGRACLSQTQKLPVFYVFTRLPLDVSTCCEEISKLILDAQTHLLFIYDVRYHYAANDVADILKAKYKHLVKPELDIINTTNGGEKIDSESRDDEKCEIKEIRKLGRIIRIPGDEQLEDYTVIYVGEESASLIIWMMNLNKCRFCRFDPVNNLAQIETLNVNKMLMKRYYMIERAKDASIVGVLAGTLGVKDHLAVMDRMKKLVKAAGKKSYTFVVGKLNVAKLANFAEIDVYMLVACPENTLVDSSEFYRPIVTPYELEVACNQAREWTGDYYTDFRELLPGAAGYVEIPADRAERCDVSLVTGAVRTLGVDAEQQRLTDADGQILQRDQLLTVANTAGEFLSERSWKGLEEKLGQTAVTKAVEGSKGIAASYNTEPPTWR